MRAWLAPALAFLLAGCTVPGSNEPDPLFGLCPQWIQGGGEQTIGRLLDGSNGTVTAETELGPAAETYQGRSLDLYRIVFEQLSVEGRLELRAVDADGRQRALLDDRSPTPRLVPVLVFTDGSAANHEFDVYLSDVSHGSTPAPAPVTLRWTFEGTRASFEASVTYHYKVCGADL
jgi:hypothetical protein